MILLKFSRPDFEYDVQALVKSFYPGFLVGSVEKEEPLLVIDTAYQESQIEVQIYGQGQTENDRTSVDYTDRKETKNRLKRLLYEMLCRRTGKTLPWGTLSGIRPAKIPVSLLEQGVDKNTIRKHMWENYLVSEEKMELAIQVAESEVRLLEQIDYEEGYSLYVGIPFCPSTCSYCSFTSYSIVKYQNIVEKYLDALCEEIEFSSELYKEKRLNTVYIGGGTPTSLTHEQLERLLNKIFSSFDFSHCLEFTLEAGRPDSITPEKLKVIRKYGIDRISINPQTMKQETLDLIGRKHTVQEVEEAFQMAREYGFSNINMDFIIGLPGESREDVEHTMEQALRLKPDCITIHSLAIKRAAQMNIQKEQFKEYELVNNEEIMKLTDEYAGKMKLEPYYLYRQKNMAGNMENVGYAAEGKECIYNILIMEEKQSILALGAGAVTKMVFPGGRIERISNVKNVEIYIDRIEEMLERKKVLIGQNSVS